jgi:hypothetical protein
MAGSIKLYGPTGYTELAARTDADDNVLTLPVSGSALASNVDLASKLDIAGGKILQIVRATDSTADRSTTSTSLTDITGMSITITPQKSNSNLILIMTLYSQIDDSGAYAQFVITDASNNILSGASIGRGASAYGTFSNEYVTLIGYVSPNTTSAVTYKGRFRRSFGTGSIATLNSATAGQLYAIEVSA